VDHEDALEEADGELELDRLPEGTGEPVSP
jgi:hypothetical protein